LLIALWRKEYLSAFSAYFGVSILCECYLRHPVPNFCRTMPASDRLAVFSYRVNLSAIDADPLPNVLDRFVVLARVLVIGYEVYDLPVDNFHCSSYTTASNLNFVPLSNNLFAPAIAVGLIIPTTG